jgi:DNA-binding transcriptional ArsR family regulator
MDRLDDRALEDVAGYFRALSVPLRLKILNSLRAGERNVTELTEELGCSQANVSKHLSVLAQGGLVEKMSRGTSTYYRIADPKVYRLCDLVCGQIGKRYAGQSGLHDMFLAATAPRRKTVQLKG